MMESELLTLFISSFVVMGLCDIALFLVEYLGDRSDRHVK